MSRLTDEDSPLPMLSMALLQLALLPEYSCSVPTGVVVGKRWRRHQPDRRSDTCHQLHDCGHWIVGEYVAGPDNSIAIQWSRVKVRESVDLAPWRVSSEPTFVKCETCGGTGFRRNDG